MTEPFGADKLANEKPDPAESSSLTLVRIPVILISIFAGFGMTYLFMRTPNTDIAGGDSRTPPQSVAQTSSASEQTTGDSETVVDIESGKQIFVSACQACHQAAGTGIPGAFPPLDGSEWVNGPPSQLVAIILMGVNGAMTVKGETFQGVMPPFKDQLSTKDIAAVASYVRAAWGNKTTPVAPELVEAMRDSFKTRSEPWDGEAELNKTPWDEVLEK